MLKCELVPVMLVDNVFGRCSAGFQRALTKTSSNMDVAYLYQQCRSGDAMLAIVHDDEAIGGAMIVRVENRQGKQTLTTLGLWCTVKGAYALLEAKQIEIAKTTGCKSLVAGGRVTGGQCGYLRRHPTAKILYMTLEVELD
jgi:hypothetical protein